MEYSSSSMQRRVSTQKGNPHAQTLPLPYASTDIFPCLNQVNEEDGLLPGAPKAAAPLAKPKPKVRINKHIVYMYIYII
jgi:hypothetical protein